MKIEPFSPVIAVKGTYVRALARDMGRLLGCYGYISKLRRTRVEASPKKRP